MDRLLSLGYQTLSIHEVLEKMMAHVIVIIALFLLAACHPLSMFRPPRLKSTMASLLVDDADHKKIKIAIDNFGIPFIKANSIHEALYGLGYMHARDRLFQLDVARHAAAGRTAELFGERALPLDRKLRMLTFRLDEQMNYLSKNDHDLLENYVRGINDGAKARGRSAEHFLLGITFEEFSKRDVIAIARLQSWHLAADLFTEIARLRVLKSNWSVKAKQEMITAIDDRGSAIIEKTTQRSNNLPWIWPNYVDKMPPDRKIHSFYNEDENRATIGLGASNALVVSGGKTNDGNAILMNDPHLHHNWPSNFYLVTLKAGDFFATGATFVGLPGILIGASQHLAWGVTASCINTQDTVYLNLSKKDPTHYVVNGQRKKLEDRPQQYCLNKKGNCIIETNKISHFGPVITQKFDPWLNPWEALAIQWTGFRVEEHVGITNDFIELAQAKNVHDGIRVVQKMTLPGVNIVLADIYGNIGYAYAGLVPKRDPSQNPYLPLDGEQANSLWPGFLAKDKNLALINPPEGYIVTANQNIFRQELSKDFPFGTQGAAPYRAMRIKEQIATMDKADFEQLSSLQLDDTSKEAQELAPLLGAICAEFFKNKDTHRRIFSEEIAKFSGVYTTDSTGALPYEMLINEIISLRLADALGDNALKSLPHTYHINYVVKDAVRKELQGHKTAIFSDLNNFSDFIGQACEQAFQKTINKAKTAKWSWRWGRHHYLQRQSPLAKAPFIGQWFKDKKRETAGTGSAPMAEAGIPITHGANLRFRVKLSQPQEIYVVLDSGNSGTVSDKNALDQVPLWQNGKSIAVGTNWERAVKNSVQRFELEFDRGKSGLRN